MTIAGVEDQTATALSLYFDADNNFDPLEPDTDATWYVPGSLLNGTSIAPSELPQSVSLIAAFTDEDGLIVSPPAGHTAATFILTDTSAYKGFAMNQGDASSADFQVPVSVSSFGSDKTARTLLLAHDYGGSTKVAATAGSWSTQQQGVPVDTDQNALPDIGWYAAGVYVPTSALTVDADDDEGPEATNPFMGDGFVAYEEFRGFVVGGQNLRSNPRKKDLFVNSLLPQGAGDSPSLLIAISPVMSTEIDSQRVVNPNYTNTGAPGDIAGHTAQKALVIVEGGWSGTGVVAVTQPIAPGPIVPNNVLSDHGLHTDDPLDKPGRQ